MLEHILTAIDNEISRLRQVRSLLGDGIDPQKRRPGRPAKLIPAPTVRVKPRVRKKMSAEAREKIRQAQIQRWERAKQGGRPSRKRTRS